jgi:DNA-directed RNA polymerase specialized sigma24 family protein
MVEYRDEEIYVRDLYRFSRLLGGDHNAAMAAIEQTCADVLRRVHAGSDAERVKIMMFVGVRDRLEKRMRASLLRGQGTGSAEGSEATSEAGEATPFSRLPEPGRTAMILFYLNTFSREGLQRLLGLGERELARLLEASRRELGTAGEVGAGSVDESAR